MIISKQYIIANQESERFHDLVVELSYFSKIIPEQEFIYKYYLANISSSIREQYTAPRTLHKIALANHYHYTEETMRSSTLALALNHLECLRLSSNRNPEEWTLICEDDIFIDNKNNFESMFSEIINKMPSDADIVWVSSGKKPLDASFMDVAGCLPKNPMILINNYFWKVSLSRYTDCILVKNSAAKELVNRFLTYKIAMPIDWEYNYILSIDDKVKSYWLHPAIIMQNPKFVDRPSH